MIRSLVKRSLFWFIVIGLAARLVCAPILTYEYDSYHWGVIMQNINSGNALYELTGYFYLPLWGYILGFIDIIWNNLLVVDVFGVSVTQLFGLEDLNHVWHLSTITSPAFNTAIKIPLIAVDLVVGYLVHRIVLEWTGDRRKADYAFGLWFLCPVVFYMAGVQAMFDNIAALFILLCILLVMKDHYLCAGVMLTLAALLKLFPGACALILILYVIKKYGTKNECLRRLGLAAAGAVITVAVVMLPDILNGDIANTITFATDRSNRYGIITTLQTLAVLAAELYLAYRYHKRETHDDKVLVAYVMYAIALTMFLGANPQYFIMFMPFLIIHIMVSDRGYMICWWLIGCGAGFAAFIQNNFSLLSGAAAFYGWPSYDWIISCMNAFETNVFGFPLMYYFDAIGMIAYYGGTALLFVLMFEKAIVSKFPKTEGAIAKMRRFGWRSSDA